MKKILFVLLAVILAGAAHAKAFDKPSDAKSLLDSVMGMVAEGKLDKAISTFKPYMPLPEEQIQGLALQAQSGRRQAKELLGETIGYEYLGKKTVGKSLIRYVYLEKTEKTPLTWVFLIMYKAQ